jgi:hypothetical protein
MKSLRACVGQHLTWALVPDADPPAYALHAGAAPCGTLRWGTNSPSFALGETADGWWTFERTGRLSRRVTVRLGATDTELDAFPYAWDGVTEVRPSPGHLYRYFQTGAPLGSWLWADPQHAELLRVTATGQVRLSPPAAASPDLSLLTLLGWYLLLLKARDERQGSRPS